jgi:hypothetical protein
LIFEVCAALKIWVVVLRFTLARSVVDSSIVKVESV